MLEKVNRNAPFLIWIITRQVQVSLKSLNLDHFRLLFASVNKSERFRFCDFSTAFVGLVSVFAGWSNQRQQESVKWKFV